MKAEKLHPQLQELYDSSYGEAQSSWRIICAEDKAKNIINLCGFFKHDRILDIGAGDGSVISSLSAKNFGKEYYALEITQNAVNIINNSSINNLVEAKLFNGSTIPYDDKFFDLVYLSHVVEHLEHPRLLLYEAMRISSYVFIEVPLEDTLLQRSNFRLNSVGHLNFYTPRSIRYLVQSCGLKILDQKVTNPSVQIYKFKSGITGIAKYYIRNIALIFLKSLAIKFFTYHSILICKEEKQN